MIFEDSKQSFIRAFVAILPPDYWSGFNCHECTNNALKLLVIKIKGTLISLHSFKYNRTRMTLIPLMLMRFSRDSVEILFTPSRRAKRLKHNLLSKQLNVALIEELPAKLPVQLPGYVLLLLLKDPPTSPAGDVGGNPQLPL